MDEVKKVGIVTIVDYNNYGNRLQNYALVFILKKLNLESKSGLNVVSREDILRWSSNNEKKMLFLIKKIIPWSIYAKYLEYKQKKYQNSLDEISKKRIERFKKFTDSYTETFPTLYVKNDSELRKIINASEYSLWIAGSDQVWNPNYTGNDYNFLSFVDSEKRFSFAASIGTSIIPTNQKERYSTRLKEMNYISVREESGAKIIKELIGKEVDVTLDPTLFLNKKEWEKIEKKPDISLSENYICTYFLGEIPDTIKKFAEDKKLPVFYLNDKNTSELYSLDPSEFIYMLNHSSYIFTDSFHAVVFSIIFEKEFYVFERKQKGAENMFTRILSITKRFDLEERITSRKEIKELPNIGKDKWEKIKMNLSEERENCLKRLKKVMLSNIK